MSFLNKCLHHCNSSLNEASYEPEDPIGMFLNRQAFITKSNRVVAASIQPLDHPIVSAGTPISQNKPRTEAHSLNELNSNPQQSAVSAGKPNKSIFHNFQKHIIHVIKKYVSFVKIRKQHPQIPQLAFCLWKTFIALKSSKKKALGIIFGFSEIFDRRQQFINLSNEYPQFAVVLENHSFEDIISTQQILRKEICKQLERLDRSSMEGQCCVLRFDEFYQYFLLFIEEIRQGPISKRLRKPKNTEEMPIEQEEERRN